jgi:hypothetical protein
MTTETRYADLLGNIPRGVFYDPNGFIIPHRSGPTQLRLITNSPNSVYKILINTVDGGQVTTDVNGNAIFSITLPKGEVVLELQRQNSTDKIISYLTVRDSATILAAIAEQIENIDDSIDSTLNSFYLERAESNDIDLAHGLVLQYPNEAAAELEAYREMLQIVRQGERQFGGRLSGKFAAVAALTQVNPLILNRAVDGPRWILGYDELPNGDFSQATKFPTGTLPTINASGQFITLKSVNDFINAGSGSLTYRWTFKRLLWEPPGGLSNVLLADANLNESTPILSDGEYVAQTGQTIAILTSLNIGSIITPSRGEFDHIYFEFNDRGTVAVNLSLGYTLPIEDKIRGYLQAHPNYREVRALNSPMSGNLADDLFVISISDGTPIGTGTIEHVSGNDYRYQAPGDSWGSAVTVIPGQTAILKSNNTDYYVTVLVAYTLISSPSDTDTIGIVRRYGVNDVFLFADNISLLGNRLAPDGGGGKVVLHDGPANYSSFPVQAAHRGMWDIPKVTTVINTDVEVGDDTIIVPIDSGARFSKSDDELQLPFEAIVGYGYRSFTTASFGVANSSSSGKEADILISGITNPDYFTPGEGGDAHVVVDYRSTSVNFTQPAGPLAGIIQVNSIIGASISPGTANIEVRPLFGPFMEGRWASPGVGFGSWRTLTTAVPGLDLTDAGGNKANVDLLATVGGLTVDTITLTTFVDDRNSGIHKILNKQSVNSFRVSYGGLGCMQSPILGVSIIKIDHRTIDSTGANPSQNGELEFDGTQLRWHEPNDSFGSWVNILAGGYFRVYSNNGKWIDVLVDAGSLPGPTPPELLFVGKFNDSPASVLVPPSTVRVWSFGERVKVTGVTPAGGLETWQLEEPFKASHDAGMTVYRADNLLPLEVESTENFGNLTVDADVSEDPGANGTDTVQIEGSVLPDGWLDTSTGGINFLTTTNSLINKAALYVTGSGEPSIVRSIPFESKDIGLAYTFKVWVRSDAPDSTAIQFRLGFNFGSGFIDSGILTVDDPDLTMRSPALLEFTQALPPSATEFTVRLKRLSGTDYDFFIERAVVVDRYTALFLGNNTIPRSLGRSNFGSLLYVWSPDELTSEETNLLGLGSPSTGIIAEIHNAHEQVDSFDVTDILSSSVVNVRGAMDDAEWNLATLTNMEVVSRTPERFSYVKPTVVSERTDTLQILSVVPPYTAALSIDSDQDKNKCVLFEDGVPVPDDQWQFNSSTEIEIVSGYNSSAIYTFTYGVLVQLETAPIDLQLPFNNNNDTWFVDYLVWNRHESEILSVNRSVSIVFDTAYEAVLPKRSDGDKFQSSLIEDTGTTSRTVPQIGWRYLDSNTIKLNSAQFNPDAIYSFQYNQQIVDPQRVVDVAAEIRSAPSVFSLGSAAYRSTSINGLVDGSLRYHQIRITLSGIVDLRDTRVHSAVIKGLRLNSTPLPPGL